MKKATATMKSGTTGAKGKKGRVSSTPSRASDASSFIDARIAELDDWRGGTLSRIRSLIRQADPDVVEEWKWGVPVWSHAGIICTGETYKSAVKMTFAKGAALEDPAGLFNSSLKGRTRRAIDFHEADKIDDRALKALIRAAVAFNTSPAPTKGAGGAKAAKRPKASSSPLEQPSRSSYAAPSDKPKLLSGGNPQIAKAYGDSPVQAYITAMPGWKRDVGRRIDAIIVRAVPGVRKAVKWNSPLYGAEDQDGSWFLSIHCFTKYIKVAFFRGTSLRPVPPEESKQRDVRYFHIHENDTLDEPLFAAWVKQASQLPGEAM